MEHKSRHTLINEAEKLKSQLQTTITVIKSLCIIIIALTIFCIFLIFKL